MVRGYNVDNGDDCGEGGELGDYTKPHTIGEFDIEDWTSFRSELGGMGYRRGDGPRSPMALIEGASIDREVAEAGICGECGKNATYYAYHTYSDERTSRRSFAACVPCNKATEF
jgi:hypothetical protein